MADTWIGNTKPFLNIFTITAKVISDNVFQVSFKEFIRWRWSIPPNSLTNRRGEVSSSTIEACVLSGMVKVISDEIILWDTITIDENQVVILGF